MHLCLKTFVAAAAVFISACSAPTPPPKAQERPTHHTPTAERFTFNNPEHPADLSAIFQALGRFSEQVSPRLAASDQDYRARYFRPWSMHRAGNSAADASWAMIYRRRTTYDRDGQLLDQAFFDALEDNLNRAAYDQDGRYAISVKGTPVRALPTLRAVMLDPSQPGEGYPFDYLQNSHLKRNAAVRIVQSSADNQWYLIDYDQGMGWVQTDALAIVDAAMRTQLRQMPLVTSTHDDQPLYSAQGVALGRSRVGELFFGDPQSPSTAVRDAHNHATLVTLAAHPSLRAFPLAWAPEELQAVGTSLLGQPYGWGELDTYRDCSSFTRDFLAPFGQWLPRNSKAQARVGQTHNLEGLSVAEKQRIIAQHAVPFRSLIELPGHVMLYIGEEQGQTRVMHSVWGVHIWPEGREQRSLIGRTAITSLAPGREQHGYRADQSELLARARKLTILPVR